MNVELENIKDHAAGFEDGPIAVVPQFESGNVTMDKQNGSPEHLECESRLNASPEQQNAGEVNVVAKESWADWGVVACVFLSNLLAAIDFTGFGVFYPFLVEHFEATTAAVGLCSSVNGFFQALVGCTVTVISVVAVDLMGVVLLPKSLALLQFIAGFARLGSPPLIGWIFDVTRDYNKAFAIAGCMAFVSGSLMVVLTVVTRCHRKSVTKDGEFPLSDKAFPNQPASDGKT